MLDLLKKTWGQIFGQPRYSFCFAEEGEGGSEDNENSENSEVENGQGEGEQNEPVNWEERALASEKSYTELKSHSDKQFNEMSSKVDRFERLLNPYQKFIKENDDGEMGFHFDQELQKPKTPTMPTDEEWIEDPKGSALRMMDIRDAEREKRETESRTQEEEQARESKENADYDKERSIGWGEITKQFPQLLKDGVNNTKDRLFCEGEKIFQEFPGIAADGNCDKFAIELAAYRLGIQPVGAGKSGNEKKKDYLIGGRGQAGQGSADGQLTDEEFFALSSEKRAAYVKEQSR